mmetsp:Transcript_5360/g.9409  ORF Transcript_5360/g.9409 Transcript_5360/m.9409 type:complete len:133 (+) Transcript_5360:140-538(+)
MVVHASAQRRPDRADCRNQSRPAGLASWQSSPVGIESFGNVCTAARWACLWKQVSEWDGTGEARVRDAKALRWSAEPSPQLGLRRHGESRSAAGLRDSACCARKPEEKQTMNGALHGASWTQARGWRERLLG